MRKKAFIIPIAVLAIVAFGTVSSAHAVVDLIALTVVAGTGFLLSVFTAEGIKRSKAELAKKKAKEKDAKLQTQDVKQVSGLKTQLAAETN
ncbi:MAG: hypothetical protein JSW04_08320 [Desulfobacterales bacterium]|nr:MAG: hypothetical protein JSV38_07085 [Desulfobacterales bacterium]UCD88472.1 MAG: hypothetical protein JSW04_08320 [Desulfobacterales bacterium]